eukprot:gene20125-7190_t
MLLQVPVIKEWYVHKRDFPIVVVQCHNDFIESEESHSNTNHASRLIHANILIDHALKSLGRAYWHTGFNEFSRAATTCKKLIDATGNVDYATRTEVVTVNQYREPHPVGVFN